MEKKPRNQLAHGCVADVNWFRIDMDVDLGLITCTVAGWKTACDQERWIDMIV